MGNSSAKNDIPTWNDEKLKLRLNMHFAIKFHTLLAVYISSILSS